MCHVRAHDYKTLNTPCPECKGEVKFWNRGDVMGPNFPSVVILCEGCKRQFGLTEWSLLQKNLLTAILKEHDFAEEEIEIVWRALPHDDFGIFHGFDETEIRKDVTAHIKLYKQYCASKLERAKLVSHHNNSSCDAQLERDICTKCGVRVDMRSAAFYPHCPTCGCRLKAMKCPQCKKLFVWC